MKGDAAIKSFERCKHRIYLIILKLRTQLGFPFNIDEILLETQEKWIECYDIYESDNQYLRYMFIVMKNDMKNKRKKEFRYFNTHVSPSDPAILRTLGANIEIESGEMTVRIMNEVAVDANMREENPLDTCQNKEAVKRIEQRLYKELHVQIFLMLVAGISVEDIAQELNYTPSHINNIRHKFIWPAVKEAMDIPDHQYDRLVSSGRIYCST